MAEPTDGAADAGGEEPVNAVRAELYRRLMEAQEQIAETLYRSDTTHEQVLAALDAVDEQITEEERREDLYLAALEHYVTALGGRVEVRVIFGEHEVVVRSAPDDKP